MTYALGRRVEAPRHADGPRDHPRRGEAQDYRISRLHPGRRRQPRVPDEHAVATQSLETHEQRDRSRRRQCMFITKKHLSSPHGAARAWARRSRCRSSTRWCRPARRSRRAARRKLRLIAMEMVHGAAGSTAFGAQEEPVVAGRDRPRLRPQRRPPDAARALSRLPDDRQQHRRAQRRGVRCRRRSAAITSARRRCS